ncbi:MAG: extracellular solute-binding protein [Chloroflexi bacterium]|nr:extracellular solute-binding protein [Chloroflexota bacterium]
MKDILEGPQTRGQTRRGVVGAAGGVIGAALLAACGAPVGSGEEAQKARQPVNLTTNIQSPASTQWGAYEAADRAIREKYPWLRMEYQGGSSSSFEAMGKLVALAASDSLPDMFYAQGTQIQFYISKKIAVSMAPYLNRDKAFDLNDFPKVAIDMYSRGGQVYAIPYDHGPQMLWYNANLFKKHGVQPPTSKWTWNDVLEAAKKLTVEGQQWGIVNNGPTAAWIMPSYFGPWGGSWVDDTETKTGINGANSVAAMQYWMDLFFKHKVAPVPGTTQGDLYLEGKAAMVFGGPWSYRGWIGKLSFESPIADWPIGPAGKRISASMGSGYPISVNSKHRDETWLYESELLGKDMNRSVMGQFVKTGFGTPVRFSMMKQFEKSEFAMPNVQIVAPAGSYSVIGRPISPIKLDLDKVWSEERAKLLKQEVSVKDMLDTVARRIQPFLDQNKGWDATK